MASRKYARDYTLQNELDNRGRLRTTAVYSGPQYRFTRETEETLPRERAVITAGAAVCLLAVLASLSLNAPVLRRWFAVLPLTVSLAGCFLLAQLAVRLFLEKPPFTRRVMNRLTERLAPCSAAVLILAGLSAAGQLVCLFRSGFSGSDWAVLGATVLLAAAAAFLFSRRRRLCVEEIPADGGIPEEAGH